MTITIPQTGSTPAGVLSESMMPPSADVQNLLKQIQERITGNSPSDSMAPPSQAVREKLTELGIY